MNEVKGGFGGGRLEPLCDSVNNQLAEQRSSIDAQ